MLKNHFTILLRQLWRNRLFTLLNIVGLAIGISSAWVIYNIVNYEFSYNKLEDGDRVFQVMTNSTTGGEVSYMSGVPMALPDALTNTVSGIEAVIPFFNEGFSVSTKNYPETRTKVILTNSQFFKTLGRIWLAGGEKPFENPLDVVITAAKADIFFPNIPYNEVLNQKITFSDSLFYQVKGVLANNTKPSDYDADIFIPFSGKTEGYSTWGSIASSNELLIKTTPGALVENVKADINKIAIKSSASTLSSGSGREFQLIPMNEAHFATNYNNVRRVESSRLYVLLGVAIALLFLAIVNYVNLSTALIPFRAKEIGIRKTLGSGRRSLIFSFLSETFILVSISTVVSWLLSNWFFQSYDFAMPDENMFAFTPIGQTILFLSFLIVAVTLLSGIYPASIITNYQPVTILRGIGIDANKNDGLSMRKALIVLQFTVAGFFIIGSLIVNKQLNFLLYNDTGFDRDAIITSYAQDESTDEEQRKNNPYALAEKLRKLPAVKSVALGIPFIFNGSSSYSFEYVNKKNETVEKNAFIKIGDPEMFTTYGLEFIAGKSYAAADTAREYVINEAAVKAFGFKNPQEAISAYLKNNATLPIVGVVKDFHVSSFRDEIKPIVMYSNISRSAVFNIKLASQNPANWQEGIAEIQKVWAASYPKNEFVPQFYDEVIEKMYVKEKQLSRLVYLATCITIIISCLGLFGLSALSAYQRTKEIGIRKVLGASVLSIVTMLSKSYILLILLSFLVAVPLVYYATTIWLEDFAYRITMPWGLYGIALLITLIITLLTVSYQAIKTGLANPVKSLRSE